MRVLSRILVIASLGNSHEIPNEQSKCCFDSAIEYVGEANRSSSGKPCLVWKTQIETSITQKIQLNLHSCQGRYLENNFCKSIDGPGSVPKCVVYWVLENEGFLWEVQFLRNFSRFCTEK